MNKRKNKKKIDPEVLKICREFKEKMQAMVDRKASGFTKMTMQFGKHPPVVIAERKEKG